MVESSIPTPVSRATLKAFRGQSDEIVRLTTQRAMQNSDQIAKHGQDAQRLIASGLRFTTLALQAAMFLGNTKLLDYQLEWANERLRHDDVMPAHIHARFQIYAEVVASLLPTDQAEAVNQYVNWIIARQQQIMESPSQ